MRTEGCPIMTLLHPTPGSSTGDDGVYTSGTTSTNKEGDECYVGGGGCTLAIFRGPPRLKNSTYYYLVAQQYGSKKKGTLARTL